VHVMATMTTVSRRKDSGQAVIELALTLPLLLLVVFGIIDFGFMFQRYEVLTNAAREGARVGVLPGYVAQDAQQRAVDYLAAGGITSNSVLTSCPANRVETARSVCVQLTTSTVTITGSSPAKTVNQVTMLVEYDHEHSFVGPIFSLFGGSWSTVRLAAASTMRVE
jgi:Flp pilus assembly protein TadG